MKQFVKIIAAVLVVAPVMAAADPLPKPVSDMECLVGTWKGGGSLTAGKDTAKLTATWNCKRTSAQFGVSCTFQVTGIPGVAVYDETDLMATSPARSSTTGTRSRTRARRTITSRRSQPGTRPGSSSTAHRKGSRSRRSST